MKCMLTLSKLIVLSLVLLLQACTMSAKKTESADVYEPNSDEEYTEARPIEEKKVEHAVSAAVLTLWERADRAREAGDYEEAIEKLEQAVRINPEDPVIWSRIAEMHLEQSRYIAAENIATKSNQLNNGSDTLLAYRNWLIIQQARQANGDLIGAEEAAKRAEALR